MFHSVIFHITTPTAWNNFEHQNYFKADSLQTEGFIHTSTIAQLEATAQRYYANENEIIVLHLDANAMQQKIKYEWASSANDFFPHIYGVIEKENILQIQSIKKIDGKFPIPFT